MKGRQKWEVIGMQRIKKYCHNLGRGLIVGVCCLTLLPIISFVLGVIVTGLAFMGEDVSEKLICKLTGEEE